MRKAVGHRQKWSTAHWGDVPKCTSANQWVDHPDSSNYSWLILCISRFYVFDIRCIVASVFIFNFLLFQQTYLAIRNDLLLILWFPGEYKVPRSGNKARFLTMSSDTEKPWKQEEERQRKKTDWDGEEWERDREIEKSGKE